jgi:cytochrome o ubiquinol oxidase subunit III
MSTDSHAIDHHHETDSTDVLGFWLYIMTDCILFSALFAAFIVLHHKGAFGPAFKPFIDLKYVLGETFFLLASNFTFGLSMLSLYRNKLNGTRMWLVFTFILGAGFVGMEINEFIHLAHEGYSWHASGAASAFFVLVGTHGFHVSMGLLWILMMLIQLPKFKITQMTKKRMTYLGMFWNFLDIVWIFLFSLVYLMGAL